MMPRKMPVAWGVPMDEMVPSIWFMNWTKLGVMPWDEVCLTMSTYLHKARNIIHARFLVSCKSEWLVMLDSDVLPPSNFLERLLAHDKKMVGGWYKAKDTGMPPVVYDLVDNAFVQRRVPGTGLEMVDGAGAGCWLMHRTVADALGSHPYDFLHGGEDMGLCRKVSDAGFEMFIDWDVACLHVGMAAI